MASPISPLEMSEWPIDQVESTLLELRPVYRGGASEDLLDLFDLLYSESQNRDDDPVADPFAATAYAASFDLIIDLLFEWPSKKQSKLILGYLSDSARASRVMGLHAAVAASQDADVRSKLLEIVKRHESDGPIEETVLALLALGESGDEGVLDSLRPLTNSVSVPVREAAARAVRNLSVMLDRVDIPPLDNKGAAITAAQVGANVFGDYRSLPLADPRSNDVQFLIIDTRHAAKSLSPKAQLATAGRVLRAGGTVLVVHPIARQWDVAYFSWASDNGILLPAGPREVRGVGVPNYGQYRSFSDFPYSLRDQPGRASEYGWTTWGDGQHAPIVTADRGAALVVVQDGVMGAGRIVFTTVDLETRPIYRENLLRWVYGDALLANTYEWIKAYDFQTGGATPHKPWATPLAGPKPKVLYLTSSLFKAGLVELLQRMDAEWRYVPYDAAFAVPAVKNEPPPRSKMGQRAACILEQRLHWADVLVFDVGERNLVRTLTSNAINGWMSIDSVPSRLRRRIYRRVHEDGMGLLSVSSSRAGEHGLKDFTPRVSSTPATRDDFVDFLEPLLPVPPSSRAPGAGQATTFEATKSGRGRILWFGQRLPHISTERESIPELKLPAAYQAPGLLEPWQPIRSADYWYAGVCKSVLWAAGLDARPRIAAIAAPTAADDRFLDVQIQLDRETNGTLHVSSRDVYNTVTPVAAAAIDGMAAVVRIPSLPSGTHVIEVQLLDPLGQVLDFGALAVHIETAASIGAIATAKRFYRPGEVAEATVEMSGTPGGTLRIWATDSYARRVFETNVPLRAEMKRAVVSIPIVDPRSRLWDIHARIERDGAPLAYRRQPIGIALPPPELDFDLTASIDNPRIMTGFFKDRMGATVAYGDPELFLRHNLSLSSGSWSSPLGASPTPGARLVPTEREPCLSSPAYRMRAIKDIQEKGPLFRDLGITDYMVADECPLGGRCYSPDSMFLFRESLKRAYGTLQALNVEWGANFSAWSDVIPCTGGTVERPGAFVDFDAFTRWQFAEYCSFLEMVASDIIPDFKAGHSGGIRDATMMHLAGALYYYGVSEAAVSMKRPGAVIGSWYAPGYKFREDHETECRRWPWWHLLRGTTRMQIWYPDTGPPAFHEDLSRPYSAFRWLKEEMDDIGSGIGKLLLHCERDEGRVGIYVSQRSELLLAAIKEIAGADGAADVSAQFAGASARIGNRLQRGFLAEHVECRFLSEFMVAGGELNRRGLKLLLMPGVICLSATEKSALRTYVKAGGVLVADMGVGTRNEHGTYVGTGFAEELFGAAALADETPALTVNEYGAGKCVYLNFAVPADAVDEAGANAFGRALIVDLLALSGAAPVVAVTEDAGPPVVVDFGNFVSGGALYAGFVLPGKGGMVADETPRDATLEFSRAYHVYNARLGEYLGEANTIATQFTPSLAQIYACLPYRLEALDLGFASPKTRRGGTANLEIRAKVGGEGPGLHVFRMEVRDANGRIQEAHSRRLLAESGRAMVTIPIALNAAPGEWTCIARDAATGVAGTATFTVR